MREVKEIKSIYITKYEASDGKRFDNQADCEAYEATLDDKRSLVKSIECTNCWIPFSGWDMDPDVSKIYLVKSESELEALRSKYAEEYSSDSEWMYSPDRYPAAYLVMARESFAIGFTLSEDFVDMFHKVGDLIHEYLCKAKQEVL